jgi:nucleotide-binding universal stress UspA family protein
MSTTSAHSSRASARSRTSLKRIAVGVDGHPEARDAVVLGETLADVTGANLMLVGIHPDPLVVLPKSMGWKERERDTRAMLTEVRDQLAPDARTLVESDVSVPRALHRVVVREHREVLVLGSSRHGEPGHVRIGNQPRQLLTGADCAIAVAPRGLHQHPFSLRKIGVGYDGGPEAREALALAASLARASGAELQVCGVVDDRMPTAGWGYAWIGDMLSRWNEVVTKEQDRLRHSVVAAIESCGAEAAVELAQGRPADELLAMSKAVDLLVVGSRRWGSVRRVLLGSTGESLLHDSSCSVLVVPRPSD